MIEYISTHAQALNVLFNGTMVLIWTLYFQVFLVNHLRQGRNMIHIDLGAAQGARSRCLVTNLSSNAVYVQAIIADLSSNGATSRTRITDREEIPLDETKDPLARTNRGTLHTGQTVDIGSLEDLVSRAQIRLHEHWSADSIDTVTITVVAISGQIDRIVAASKSFDSEHLDDGGSVFTAKNILTHQIRPRQTREEFSQMLRDQKFG
ncbi:hypothetical protein [Roseicitreum antarcticum]|uniref:Uncharacterized protein n=1 Tax=Roseicitreum antarcticum TaxID=564137 RepID=A0A1H2VGN2_9RHOB|nr:hypothetical protein [Roseicitreum antarcticum]SDW67536.1 hypothetical protein SAMN04488238_10365 [Roseicitreum antarcticum]